MDAIGLSILTGMKPWLTSIDYMVANRFNKIQHRIVEREGDYIYGSSRCFPENLAWRMKQNCWQALGIAPCVVHSLDFSPVNKIKWWVGAVTLRLRIFIGRCDASIIATYHEGAAAAYWYRYEKEW